jgi:predicted Fe-S protein YdhL (DUF1289 family)
MLPDFRQSVPQDFCLACRGCCRFREEPSDWQPRMAPSEVAALSCLEAAKLGTAINPDHALKSRWEGDDLFCAMLNPLDHHCQIYSSRPFECQLYPALLVWRGREAWLGWHTLCPFSASSDCPPRPAGGEGQGDMGEYRAYLQEFFRQPALLAFLRENPFIIHRYDGAHDEIDFLFPIKVMT